MMFSKKFIQRQKEFNTYEKHVPAPYFRRAFSLAEKPKKAEITICGLGFYELYINGKRVTKGKLAPYISNPDDIVYYDNYDVTEHLNRGVNVVGVLLGNGFLNDPCGNIWDFDKAAFRDAPKVALALEVDGELLFEADEKFKTYPSPITFDDYRAGEQYDARLENPSWCSPKFVDMLWQQAIEAKTPLGEPKIAECEPISVVRELKPTKIVKQNGGHLYIFPENTTGICRLKIKGEKGQKIILDHGELLVDGVFTRRNICFNRGENGSNYEYIHRDVYICKGGDETYEPTFTYHGFQYVFVSGLTDKQATKGLLTALVMHSKLDTGGSFSCSDSVLNKIQENTRRSTITNFHYFPTDCPHREKNGWTGDATLSAVQIMYNYRAENSLREWLHNIRLAQREDGALPGIVPTSGWGFKWGNGPAWDAIITEIPYVLYRFTGNREVIAENAPAICKYIAYIRTKINAEGLLAYGLGDWCEAGIVSASTYRTPLDITDTTTCIDILQKSAKIFAILGMNAESEAALSLREKLRSALRKKYLENGLIKSEAALQTAYAMFIYYGVFEENEKAEAAKTLAKIVENDGRFAVGILGGRVLFRVLSEFGYADLAYKIVTTKDAPSYGQHVAHGATTLFEDFNELYKNQLALKNPDSTHSLNHHFWGDISAWMIESVAGLTVNPNLENPYHVKINPRPITSLKHAKAQYSYGGETITVSWKREGSAVKIDVENCGEFVIID